ncbi:MAG TPA: acetate--CoA ligase family protein [Terracidiphilus sp.]|nr:acetate--CoA ligase family protein [Terracidiphilus sp.]
MNPNSAHEATVARPSLRRLLAPRSVAIVGASETPGSLGESVLSNLEEAGFAGDLHLINPKRNQIRGRACLSSVEALPSGVDCAILAIPQNGVLDAVEACARRNVGSLIVFSAGFRESGEAGRVAESRLTAIAREHAIAIEGPNCLGLVNYVDRLPLTFIRTPMGEPAVAPSVAVLSQSGALAAVLGVNLHHHGLQISYSISTGNEAACSIEDFLEYLLEDEHTQAFVMVVEQFREPRRFLRLAARAQTLGKFLVLLHPGSSAAARSSAITHTGAMTGDYAVMRVKVANAGVIVVDTLEELVDVAQLLIRRPVLPQGGAAVFTESGAFKGLALDLCERIGLRLPELSASAGDALSKVLPDFIPPTNPMDLTAQALVYPALYRRTLPIFLAEDRFGSVVLVIILTDAATCELKFPPILDAIRSLATTKPLIFAALDEGAPAPAHYIAELRSLSVPFYPSPERALRAVAHVTHTAAQKAFAAELPALDFGLPFPDGNVPEWRCKQVVAQCGIAVPEGALARTLDEAIAIAGRIGFPVVLKAQSADLPHKSDVGGVVLGVENTDALAAGWQQLHREISRAKPGLELDGVLVERMAKPGIELFAGARKDPEWGPVLLVGFGGVLAEALHDVRLLVPGAPVEAIEAELHELECSPLLRGFRGAPPCDLQAAARIVFALGELIRVHPEIQEIDLNPVVVYPEGNGAMALDAFVVASGAPLAAPAYSSIASPT